MTVTTEQWQAMTGLEASFLFTARAVRMPEPEVEYRFLPKRRFRFDFAWPDWKLAVEVEGGQWGTGPACELCGQRAPGRHTRGKGLAADAEKYNLAAIAGWTVLRFTESMIENGEAGLQLEMVMERHRVRRSGIPPSEHPATVSKG